MGFFLFFVWPWIAALSLSSISEEDASRLWQGVEAVYVSMGVVLKPICYLVLIALPFVATHFLSVILASSGDLGVPGAFLQFIVFSFYPLSLFLIFKIVLCGVNNLRALRSQRQ